MRVYVVLDVFTSTPLTGNQLAVFTDAAELDGALMQRAARELNLSETVFIVGADADYDAHIRIFTPGAELPFAGHPVLGSAYVVGERLGLDRVRLRTAAGIVNVVLTREHGAIVQGEMEQPLPVVSAFERSGELPAALGVTRAELPIERYVNGPEHVLVTLADEAAVAALAPDAGALAALGELCVSCFAGAGRRYTTRMFAPRLGVAEDPATGSAAGPLALHLVRHGRLGFGEGIEIHQGAQIRRPSLLRARIEGSDGGVERVAVGGAAVLVARGAYLL
ncbi:MAG: PhzF family phenazine biosynthesis protein [Solirubrobacteraceae bacterium]